MRLVCGSCQMEAAGNGETLPCARCGDVLEIRLDVKESPPAAARFQFRARLSSALPRERSGVWRFRELLPGFDDAEIVSLGEGNAPEMAGERASAWSELQRLQFKLLGLNPTGSYKDAGMTVAVTRARSIGASILACASTGNTGASLAVYAARAGLRAVVLLPEGQVTAAKLAQTQDAGAKVFSISGDFDSAMAEVRALALRNLVYPVNSLNPYRREGQKTVAFEILEQRGWRAPDWVIVPGGNLGHCVSLGKGFEEARALGLSDRVPRIAVVQAAGAAPFVRAFSDDAPLRPIRAKTFASAIQIGNPVSWRAALRVLHATGGTAIAVDDESIAHARAILARDGLACEPASAASLAGASSLRAKQIIRPEDDVVAILTGSSLKDSAHIAEYHGDASRPLSNPVHLVGSDSESLERALFAGIV